MSKNDLSHLLDLKIDIQTNNDSHYQELAILFDKTEFLQLLPILRKEYNATTLLNPTEYKEYFNDVDPGSAWEYPENFTINLAKYSRVNSLKKQYPDFYDLLTTRDDYPVMLERESYYLCYELGRPPHFYKAIRQAIFCQTVTTDDYKPTEALVIDPTSLWFDLYTPPTVGIFVSPTSTYEDVKEELRKAKKLMANDERLSYYQPRINYAPNIRKYRDWYWAQIDGKKLKQIANEWGDQHHDYNISYTEVLKGIQAYKKLLSL